MIDKYKIITLCGSTRFKEEFIRAQKELTLAGNIVISVGLFGHSGDSEAWDDGVKEMLDDMHKRKIDMADAIMVIDVNDYIGESTKKEIEYAKSKGKFVYFYTHPEMYYDDIGGLHDSGIGYNPNGVYCGECGTLTCRECSNATVTEEGDITKMST